MISELLFLCFPVIGFFSFCQAVKEKHNLKWGEKEKKCAWKCETRKEIGGRVPGEEPDTYWCFPRRKERFVPQNRKEWAVNSKEHTLPPTPPGSQESKWEQPLNCQENREAAETHCAEQSFMHNPNTHVAALVNLMLGIRSIGFIQVKRVRREWRGWLLGLGQNFAYFGELCHTQYLQPRAHSPLFAQMWYVPLFMYDSTLAIGPSLQPQDIVSCLHVWTLSLTLSGEISDSY